MNLQFKDELPVKYIVDSYRFLPKYPNREDLLFDFINYIIQGKQKNKKITLADFVIDVRDFRNIFKYDLTDEFKENLKELLKDLKENSYIATDNTKIILQEKALTLFYKIHD